MNWNYFKTNWFLIAMSALICFAVMRKFPQLNPFKKTHRNAVLEKVTESKTERKTGASLLGYVPESSGSLPSAVSVVSDEKTEAFLKRFASVAMSERKKFGIPASVILAASFANSRAGQLETATAANNYFGLSCSTDWEGETAQIGGSCLRKYESAWASFRDFSIHLTNQEWFGSHKKSAGKDWQKWVEKLGKSDIADPKAMRTLIETYKLDELDNLK